MSLSLRLGSLRLATSAFVDSRVNVGAMPREILLDAHEPFQRRIDVVEIDVGDEAVDPGIGAGRVGAEQKPRLGFTGASMIRLDLLIRWAMIASLSPIVVSSSSM